MYTLKDTEHLSTKPGMESSWSRAVESNQDGYGHGVVDATVAVGAALDRGETPALAEKACHGLGITGFMAGCMASWISQFHPRGEEFRCWWNKDTAIGDEGDRANESGGVLNPAVLRFSGAQE